MISGLSSEGAHLVVTGGSPGTLFVDDSRPLAGTVKFDSKMGSLLVFDGGLWLSLPRSYASVSLTPAANAAIGWAVQKMEEEKQQYLLAEKHPAIQIAMANLEKAKQQLDATIILSKEHV